MTDQELKDLVASLAISQSQTDKQLKETFQGIRELRESQSQTDKQLRESQAQTDKQLRESQAQTDKQLRETDKQLRETDKQLKELGQQIGGLGNKFGGFTEGLFYPSLKKILFERFGMEKIFPNVTSKKAGLMELDILGCTDTSVNEVYVVEIKSHLDERGLLQFERTLRRFLDSFPEHRGKKLFGLLAFIQGSESVIDRARRKGFYLVRVEDEMAELLFDKNFAAKDYSKP